MLNLELLVTRETGVNGMSVCLKPRVSVVITPGLVDEVRRLQNSLAEKYISHHLTENFYVIWFLENRKRTSYRGLDFNFILKCLKNDKNAELEHYIDGIFNLMFLNHIGLGFPIINCSIVSRALSGLSQEFFYTNQVCFIHKPDSSGIKKISIAEENRQLLLNKDIYEHNHYYHFDFLRLNKMRDIIQDVNHPIPSTDEVNIIKQEFETFKEETLLRIYKTASKNLKIIEKMANADQRVTV